MRLVSWNVNGFRSVLKKGFMAWLEATDPDVLSLQEIRCNWEEVDLGTRQMLESAYDICWHPSSAKKGYAGSATLTRKGLGWHHSPSIDLLDADAEGRMIQSTLGDWVLLAGYFPNASSGLMRLPFKRAFAQHLAERVRHLHAAGRKVILAGDMNVAPEEIDLARPKDNRENPGFTDEEREDFRGYLAAGLVDVLRDRNPGVSGLYSWWTARGGARAKNVGWRIDLFLVSRALEEQVRDVGIWPEILGSDHAPIYLELN